MKILASIAVLTLFPTLVLADNAEEEFLQSLGLERLVEVMSLEGKADSALLPEEVFGSSGGAAWQAELDLIYDPQTMFDTAAEAFWEVFDPSYLVDAQDFAESQAWQSALDLEVSARKALLDPDVEDLVFENAWAAAGTNSPRARQIRRLIDVGDMVTYNVEGSMNSMLAYYIGLADGGFDIGLGNEELYAMIMAEEEVMFEEIEEWLFAVLLMAYDPLSDRHLERQIAFWGTQPGETLNAAVFHAFDVMFADLSYKLGVASAQMMGEQLL